MSTTSKLTIHTNAVNLARRWSVQNENDLMQEDMYDNTMDIAKPVMDHSYCQDLAAHLTHYSSLPAECRKFKDVSSELQRRDTDTTHPSQILS